MRWSMRWCVTSSRADRCCTDTSWPGHSPEAAELLALVAGQDVEAGEDGVFRIAQRWRGTG